MALESQTKSAKKNGGYDATNECHLIPKTVILPGMQEIIDSNYFQNMIEWDKRVHRLANRSLDMTIDQIGKDKFQDALSTFLHARQVAEEKCSDEVTFPCSRGGMNATNNTHGKRWPTNQIDCLFNDSGCGYVCLDDVATELGLWGKWRPLTYPFPRAFMMGNSTRKRLGARLSKPKMDATAQPQTETKAKKL